MPGIERIATVTAPAADYDLVDLATVKSELRKTDKDDDDLLKKYITWSSAAIASEVNRVFVAETIQDKFFSQRYSQGVGQSNRREQLGLSRWPVVSIAAITEDGTALVANTDYTLDASNGFLFRLDTDASNIRRWTLWPVIVSYVGGYATIPGDIVDAAVRMVKNRWRLRDRDPYLKSENIPGVRDASWWIATGNEAGNMPPDVAAIIDSYRVPVFG